jgi:hypothetical protein
MPTDTTVVEKPITSAFVLDRVKLARILDIMEQRFVDANIPFNPTFDVTLAKGRRISTNSSDQLLALDNSVKNPITTLVISAAGSTPNELACTLSFDKSARRNINLQVEAEDGKRASQCFAELEEQVERTLSNDWMRKLTFENILGIFMGVIIVLVIILVLVARFC